jgi:hypothetical protein
MTADQIRAEFEKLKLGAAPWPEYEAAKRNFITRFIHKPNGVTFLQNVFPDLDVAYWEKELPAPQLDSSDMMLEAVRAQLPMIQTQADLDTFAVAFEAFVVMMKAAFGGDAATLTRSERALAQAVVGIQQARRVVEAAKEVPADQLSPALKDAVAPPKQFYEREVQARLLMELANIHGKTALSTWYEANRADMDRIGNRLLRNELFDSIRAKMGST